MLKHLRERADRILQNADVKRAISWAGETSRRVRANLAETRKQLTEALSFEGHDDLEALKRKLDRMTEAQQSNAQEKDKSR